MSTRQISFAIQGMFCPKCAGNIERALTQLDGVVVAQVNYATERATVVYDPTRIPALTIVNALRSIAFDTPLERVTLHADGLLYATSAQTVEKVLERAEGVVQVSADLAARRVTLEVFPERSHRGDLERLLARLGFRAFEAVSSDAWLEFAIRGLVITALALLLAWGAVNHLGLFAPAGELPSFILLAAFDALALFGVGWPFFRRAFAALAQGEFDVSVLIALGASAAFLCGAVLAPISSARRVWGWSAWGGLMLATLLTAGWFVARGFTVLVLPRLAAHQRTLADHLAPQTQLGVISNGSRH